MHYLQNKLYLLLLQISVKRSGFRMASPENLESLDYMSADYNGTEDGLPSNMSELYRESILALLITLDRERDIAVYVSHAYAATIAVVNIVLACVILLNRKQRSHFRNWLILHITFLHILYGAISLPFKAQMLQAPAAGLGKTVAVCKLLHFICDILVYMLNISVGILGIYQCIMVLSPRLLKSVSSALLASIMMVLPWLVAFMLTAVLRLTMSEEQYGQCYIVSDTTAETLWLVLSRLLPYLLMTTCCLLLAATSCMALVATTTSSQQSRKQEMTYFVTICLALCITLRLPSQLVVYPPIQVQCIESFGRLFCSRLNYSMNYLNSTTMILIPLAYLIPKVIVKRCKKSFPGIACKSRECNQTQAKKSQAIEMVPVQTERSPV